MRIAIVGAGKGGTSLLEILSEDPTVQITGVADRGKTAPGIRLAKALTIPTTADFRTLLNKKNDIIINEILRTLGDLIRRNIRETDIPARYGGEEFSIIMPETNRTRGKLIAERLRKAIADYPFKNAKQQPGGALNVSIGLASYPENAASPHDLIEAADRALYRAKSTGRNRVCISTKSGGRGPGGRK